MFQAAVAASIARPSKRIEQNVAQGAPAWATAFLRGAIIPFALAWSLVVRGAELAVSHCPGADKASALAD